MGELVGWGSGGEERRRGVGAGGSGDLGRGEGGGGGGGAGATLCTGLLILSGLGTGGWGENVFLAGWTTRLEAR